MLCFLFELPWVLQAHQISLKQPSADPSGQFARCLHFSAIGFPSALSSTSGTGDDFNPPPQAQHACEASTPFTPHLAKSTYAGFQPVPYPPSKVHHCSSEYCEHGACVLLSQSIGESSHVDGGCPGSVGIRSSAAGSAGVSCGGVTAVSCVGVFPPPQAQHAWDPSTPSTAHLAKVPYPDDHPVP